MSARTQLVELLEAKLDGAVWQVLPFERKLGDIRRPVVMVSTQRIERGPSAGTWLATMRALVVAPHEDYDTAETLLEGGVLEVLEVFDGINNVSLGAESVTVENKHHAYRVDLQITLPKGE